NLLRLVGSGPGARDRALGARNRFARRADFGPRARRPRAQIRTRDVERCLSLQLQPTAVAAVEDRDLTLQQELPAILRKKETLRIRRLRLEDCLDGRPVILRAVAQHAFGGLLFGREELQVGSEL